MNQSDESSKVSMISIMYRAKYANLPEVMETKPVDHLDEGDNSTRLQKCLGSWLSIESGSCQRTDTIIAA